MKPRATDDRLTRESNGRMNGKLRLLAVGPRPFSEAVARLLPAAQVLAAEHPLEGLWRLGHEHYSGVILSLSAGRNIKRAIQSMRELAADVRILVACPPASEPEARLALRDGASDYLLEPLRRDDLETALGLMRPPRAPLAALSAGGESDDIRRLTRVLESAGEGTQAMLDRIALELRDVLGAVGVYVEFGAQSAVVGDAADPVFEEPVRAGGQRVVGRICVGRRRDGSYAGHVAAELAAWAELVASLMGLGSDVSHWRTQAASDDVTGLLNRRAFDQQTDAALERAAARRERATLILLLVEGLGEYGVQFGPEQGDRLLAELAGLLRRSVRRTDLVARLRGAELALLLTDAEPPRVPGSRHPTDPAVFAERIRGALAAASAGLVGPAAPGQIALRVALASYPWEATGRAQLLAAARASLLEPRRASASPLRLTGAAERATGER
jgi:diguanylate cyclase (GGDEF)-like protein